MAKETWVIIPDIHVPFACKKYLSVIEKLLKKLKPNGGIVQLGDALDMFQVSKYPKDPARQNRIYQDIEEYSELLDRWEELLPKDTEIHCLEGNHEDRLRRWIWDKCPELAEMFSSVPDALKFKERNKRGKVFYVWHPLSQWDDCKIGDHIFHHGVFFNEHVAVGNLKRYQVPMVTGHTHRVQKACNGTACHTSLGHGSDEHLTAHNPVPTGWQQAVGVYTVVKGKGSLEIILVKDGNAMFRGTEL